MPRSSIISMMYRRMSSSMCWRLAVFISGLRERMVVTQPVAWKKQPYSMAHAGVMLGHPASASQVSGVTPSARSRNFSTRCVWVRGRPSTKRT